MTRPIVAAAAMAILAPIVNGAVVEDSMETVDVILLGCAVVGPSIQILGCGRYVLHSQLPLKRLQVVISDTHSEQCWVQPGPYMPSSHSA